MIQKWLSNTFNPPAWNNNVLKGNSYEHNYTYKTTSIIFGLVASAGIAGGIFAFTLSYPEKAAQIREDLFHSISQSFISDNSAPGMTPD